MLGVEGSSTPYAPSSSHLGVTRSRTLFFLSIRDSLAPGGTAASSSHAPLLGGDNGDHHVSPADDVYFDVDRHDVSVSLPPFWVDTTDEVDAILTAMIPKLQELDRLHAQHLLPSFADKSAQKREIEALTEDVTQDFRRASQHVSKLVAQTTEALRSKRLSKHEAMAARNAQTALATRVQHMSSMFRRKQSQYLRRLQGMEVQEEKKPSDAWLLDDESSIQEDVALVRLGSADLSRNVCKVIRSSKHFSMSKTIHYRPFKRETRKSHKLRAPFPSWRTCFRTSLRWSLSKARCWIALTTISNPWPQTSSIRRPS